MNICYKDTVDLTAKILTEKDDWREAFLRYATNIKNATGVYSAAADILKCHLPSEMGLLRISSSIQLVQKSSKSAYFDLRIFGQSVGGLTIKNDKLYLTVTPDQQKNNRNRLEIETKAHPTNKPYLWDSNEAKEIIKTFVEYKGEGANVRFKEHKYETLILHDLVQTSSNNKHITYCRPVMLGEYGFFQMRTVFGASKHEPQYVMCGRAVKGGGIDILARIRHKDGSWRLAVMELKDDNKAAESQPVVMTQAMIYATFIGYLLRDEKCGKLWWNIFRNKKEDETKVKPHLDIDVITVMPPDKTGKLSESKFEEIHIPGIDNVTLHPYSLYVDVDFKKSIIKGISGSLCKVKKQ